MILFLNTVCKANKLGRLIWEADQAFMSPWLPHCQSDVASFSCLTLTSILLPQLDCLQQAALEAVQVIQ